ncbi:MAG TPA: 30S ribosomal protein S17 [Bryobacteraceae bacterium]|jgi:small subunit ribosomal protein S17|nr:30S ribosomal protein S17 [Bryobacteraceae bacterium]
MATAETAEQKPIGNKNEKVGQVVSSKMQKTIVVEVTRRVQHPVYKRIINKRKKFYAHDEQQTAQVGDVVRIIECRPISKLKRWRLGEVLRKAVQVAVDPSAVDLDLMQPTAGSKSPTAKGTKRKKS